MCFTLVMISLTWDIWRAYPLFCKTSLGGHFWENKLSLGIHGEMIPQVGCGRPTHQIIEICLWMLTWHHGWSYQSPSAQMIFLGEEKCHFLRVDVMLEGVWWWWSECTLTLGMFWPDESWIDPSTWWGGSWSPNDLYFPLQGLAQVIKTSPKWMTSSYF